MVDYDNMGPSLQLVGARFLNFLLSKLTRDFRLRGMSILQDFQMAIFPQACGKYRKLTKTNQKLTENYRNQLKIFQESINNKFAKRTFV